MNRDSKSTSKPGSQPGSKPSGKTGQQPQQGGSQVQGEGDYEANRRYRDSAEQFAQDSDKVEQAGADAAPDSAEQAEQMRDAEDKGRKKARK